MIFLNRCTRVVISGFEDSQQDLDIGKKPDLGVFSDDAQVCWKNQWIWSSEEIFDDDDDNDDVRSALRVSYNM